MTSNELRKLFNDKFGNEKWPKTYEVDHETYANICQDIFDHHVQSKTMFWDSVENAKDITDFQVIGIFLGLTKNGIMFKNVELILKSREMMK